LKYLLRSTLVVWLLVSSVTAQDPLKVAPQAYKLEFENEWVRVMRVHYGPRVKIPVHDHTRWGAAFVYLNDSAEIIFRHVGLELGAVTRPPTKTGSFRLFKAVKEVHEVENPTKTPSDFLRVEFKTEAVGEKSLRGRYYREAHSVRENYHKVQFENEQIRITRLVCAPGKILEVVANSSDPALLVALSPARLNTRGEKGPSTRLDLKLGETRWIGTVRQEFFENLGVKPVEFLRFEFKTKPSG